ncbi:MAG TPA: alpha-amylase family protein [Planctomycetota bacterium]|nr:alpha-amylase family protein [Planctomycetota bacterium]
MNHRLAVSVLLAGSLGALTACTRSSSSGSGSTAPASSTTALVASAQQRIAITPRGLAINGKTTLFYGGEVHYFRTRDPNWDVTKTWQMWETTLDQLQAAGMNLVSVYVPWCFHEETEGSVDFTGVRDLDHFLESCWKRGLYVNFRPGPYIQGEWPYGIHTFGAVPYWWKVKYPGALAMGPGNVIFNFDEYFGSPFGVVASFYAPDFATATEHWFSICAPIIKKYVYDRPTIITVQLDDETNYYFHSRFASDYGPDGIAQYHAWLRNKYGAITALNALYGTTYGSFDDVVPPTAPAPQPQDNLSVQDWFDAGKDGMVDYHMMLRRTMESCGIHEPDILFLTNDEPHSMPLEYLVAWDGPNKNKAGLGTESAYPKMWPWSADRPTDAPWETSFFTKRFLYANRYYSFAGQPPEVRRGVIGTELEGGMFDSPVSFMPLEIPAHTTDHVMAEFFGHGGVSASIYMFRGGYDEDGEVYYRNGCVDETGVPTSRYQVVQTWGQNVLVPHAQEILQSEEVETPVCVVVGSHYEVPAAGIAGDPGWIQTREAGAIFGWFEDAGFPAAILDAPRVKQGDLDPYKLVIYVNPDATEDACAAALADYVNRGGVLFNLMHKGDHDEKWQPSGVGPDLLGAGLFKEGTLSSVDEEVLGIVFPDSVYFDLPNGFQGSLPSSMFMSKYDVAPVASVFATESATGGKAVGWTAAKGSGEVIFLGTNPARIYRDSSFYDASPSDFATARAVAQWVASRAGLSPVMNVLDCKARAIARTVDASVGGGLLVFMMSRLSTADTAVVQLLDLGKLGLNPWQTYTIVDWVSGKTLGSATGSVLQSTGFAVPLDAYGTAVVRVQ